MSFLRRSAWGVLLVVIALTACRKKAEAPHEVEERKAVAPGRVETEAVAGDLPAGATLVLSAHDLESYWSRFKATRFYTQLRAIPEVQRALDPGQNPRLAQFLQRFQATAGVPLNEQTLFRTLGKKIQFGLYPVAGDTTVQRVVVVADMGDKDALASILKGLQTSTEAQGVKFTTEKYRGVDVTVASDAGGSVRALYGFHKEKLVAASDQAGLQGAVAALDGEGSTMARDTLYQRTLTHLGDANLTFFVNRGGYKGLVGAVDRARVSAGDTTAPGESDRMLEVVDKYNIQSATVIGSHWEEDGLVIRSYSTLDPRSAGAAPLREMLQIPPSEVEVLGYFPDSTLGFYALNFLDAPKIYDFAVAYLKDAARAGGSAGRGGEAAARIDQEITEFQQKTGMEIRKDVLGWMGREAAMGLNGVVKGGFFPVPELSLAIQSTDPARAKNFFDKLEAWVTAEMQASPLGFPVQFQEEDYKGVKVRYAPTPIGEGLGPAYAFHEDYVLVALSPGTLKRMLDVKSGSAPAVASNAQFKALSGFFPGEVNLVGYANTLQLLTEIGSILSTFQQMGSQQASAAQDTFTRTLEALKNLQAVGTYWVNDAGGIEQRFLVKIQ